MGLQILSIDGFQQEFAFPCSWGPQITKFSPVVKIATRGNWFQRQKAMIIYALHLPMSKYT